MELENEVDFNDCLNKLFNGKYFDHNDEQCLKDQFFHAFKPVAMGVRNFYNHIKSFN